MARRHPHAAKFLGVGACPTLVVPEAASATFEKGAPIVPSSGYGAEGGVNPTLIIGLATADGHNDASAGTHDINIEVASPQSIFEFSLDKASSLGLALLQTHLFSEYGLTEDSGGVWYVDVDKTGGDARVVVVGLKDAIGTVSARVYVQFLVTNATLYLSS